MAPNDKNEKTPGSIVDTAIDSAKGGMDTARAKIHEATKTEEQKEAEKSITDKVGEALPDSAEEAGSKLGSAIDSGVQQAKDAFDIEKK
ncbi:unnamed protein product [Cylindrotheca closterium]|uniref:Uncharacterized protein n=1 Tax=Cylindrotheca closterium TaxID=2856 RepID=A0AAD2FEL2_9STRA|nr:unnamed protein product [Cylindrotheca closterium]